MADCTVKPFISFVNTGFSFLNCFLLVNARVKLSSSTELFPSPLANQNRETI
jgi:hypothetical protein